jgi:hypothetical protein
MKLQTMMKALAYAALLGACTASAWAAPVTVVSTLAPVVEGSTFDIDVRVTEAADLYAFQFDLLFDPAVVSILSVAQGGFLPLVGETVPLLGTIDNAAGSVEAVADTLVGPLPGASGDGLLFSFRARALSVGTTAFSLVNEIYLDSELEDISADFSSLAGSITVTPRTTLPGPSSLLLLLSGCVAIFRARNRRGVA